jgi:hypothetical protein
MSPHEQAAVYRLLMLGYPMWLVPEVEVFIKELERVLSSERKKRAAANEALKKVPYRFICGLYHCLLIF